MLIGLQSISNVCTITRVNERFCYCGGAITPPRRIYCSLICQERAAHAAAYGIDGPAFALLLREQRGLCALCDRRFHPEGFGPVIDHDHATGAVRGLLCQSCNLRIGYFERGHRVFPPGSTFEEFAGRASLYLSRGRDAG